MKNSLILQLASLSCIAIIARLMPPFGEMSPLWPVVFYVGYQYGAKTGLLLSTFMLLVSDAGLSFWYGYPFMGTWTFFILSGLWISVYVASRCGSVKYVLYHMPGTTILFWAWTNLDTWTMTDMYGHTPHGFILCYVMALPFLKTALWVNAVWLVMLLILSYRNIFSFFRFYNVNKSLNV